MVDNITRANTIVDTPEGPAYADTDPADVADALRAAAAANGPWRATSWETRACALEKIAESLAAHAEPLIDLARRETNLLEPRLRGELKRTTFQLRFFADLIRAGWHAGVTIDHPDPEWPMGAPRPDLRRHKRPIGPVLVFAASNFPFAFSVAGGDTASALAAGCPVVVKAHPGHPRLSSATAELIRDALDAVNAPYGTFALIHGTEAGRQAMLSPVIQAASFTGSIAGGRALFDLAASRSQPIPFYGELGSTNPVAITHAAATARPHQIAEDFVASVTGSSGQLCTKPGLLFVTDGTPLVDTLAAAALPATHPLLNTRIEESFRDSATRLRAHPGVEVLNAAAEGNAVLFCVDATVFGRAPELAEECFGPASLIVRCRDEAQMARLMADLPGQLTASIFGEDEEIDSAYVHHLIEVAADLAGRVLWNQWPTGLSVTWAQQHGGPYPATTHALSTSVGASAIERFLRPVAFQGLPRELLPCDLVESTGSAALPRLVDGRSVER